MTLEDIEKAHLREAQIRRLRREINDLRDNTLPSKVRSIEVNGEIQYTSGGRSSLPSSPVESHFRSLERLEEKLLLLEKLELERWELKPLLPPQLKPRLPPPAPPLPKIKTSLDQNYTYLIIQ